ncbi:MAG: hypothetical protein LH481_14240 [Burkholderiales bacterium]|nr:hypothetical protein [Burkholderiales bacterium]
MHARKLDGREISNEREQVRKNFQVEQSEFNRVKLAILLASTTAPSPATGTSDDNELGALLAPIVRVVNTQTAVVPANAGTSEIRTLATLIYALALDRKKVRDYSRDVQLRAHALRRDDSKEVETRALRARG